MTLMHHRLRWLRADANPRNAAFRLRCLVPVHAIAARGHDAGLYRHGEAVDRATTLVVDAWSVFPSTSSPEHGKAIAEIAEGARSAGARLVVDNCDNPFACTTMVEGWADALQRLRRLLSAADRIVVCSSELGRALLAIDPSISVPRVIDDVVGREPSVVGDAWWKPYLSPGRWQARASLASHRRRLDRERALGYTHLVWFGNHGTRFSSGGMLDLESIHGALMATAKRHPITLTVISNHRPKFERMTRTWAIPTRYLDWDRASFPDALAAHDICVIPSVDNGFTRCKSSNRLLTALYLGLPVIADPVPSYLPFSDLAAIGNWFESLPNAITELTALQSTVRAARTSLLQSNGVDAITDQWCEALEVPNRK